MNTKEKERKRRPARSARRKSVSAVKKPASPRPQRSASSDVVYLPPKPFQRNRLILHLATVAAVVLALMLGISVFFKINEEKILVSGNEKYSAWDIIQASGLQDGENLLTFSKAGAAGKIRLALPYVEQVRFGIKLPDTVMIEVVEIQVTYAVKDQAGSWWLISSGGKVVSEAKAGEETGYTRLLGVQIQNPQPGESAVAWENSQVQTDPQGQTLPVTVTQAQRLSTCLDIAGFLELNGVIGQAASVDVSQMGDIRLQYGEQFQVRLGDTTQLGYKVACMKAAIDKMSSYQTGVLDVTFTILPNQVGFQPDEGSSGSDSDAG